MTEDRNTPRKPSRKLTIALAVAAATAVSGVVGYQAIAETKTGQHAITAVKHGGWGGGHRKAMSAEEMDKKIERMVAHAAIEIEASDEQRDQVTAIAKAAAAEIRPIRQAMREDAEKLKTLLLADVVNPTEVEALRAARLADFDAKSKVFSKALTDIATVLTPEQRRLAEERIRDFRGKRGNWRH